MNKTFHSAVLALSIAFLGSAPVHAGWKAASGGNVPVGAVTAGHEQNGDPLFVCRANYKGGVHPGKVRQAFGACNIGWGGGEHKVSNYEVLTSESDQIWRAARGGHVPVGAVSAGNESNGDALFVCRAKYNGGLHPGKVRQAFGACNIGWGGGEHKVNSYEVLGK